MRIKTKQLNIDRFFDCGRNLAGCFVAAMDEKFFDAEEKPQTILRRERTADEQELEDLLGFFRRQ